jgi:REP element-mobilizing transposase RayT
MLIASHIVISGYGTWLSNDPRGSGSTDTRKPELDELGPVHHGRKRIQPPMNDLRAFYREAEPLLDFPVLWFNEAQRNVIGVAFARVVRENNYTVWACAVCRNHAHLCVRRHRDFDNVIRDKFANGARAALLAEFPIKPAHPVWSSRPYAVFLNSPDEVLSRVKYIRENPMKEGLAEQKWDFVKPYDGWPGRRWNLKQKPGD